MVEEEENRLSSDFSFDSSYNEEYNRVVPVESTPQSGFRQEIVGRNEFHQQFDKYETINNVAETNYPKTMNQHNLNQHQHEHQQQPVHASEELQHVSETKPSALSNRKVSIIDETNRTRDKISKKRRKKTTRLRKPLQNDDLLKNYFEMDTVSSNQVTTFKIIQSDSTNDASHALSHHDQPPHEQQTCCNESFITKETFQVSNTKDSKLSESSEESNNRTSISSLTESSHNTSSFYHNNPITLQELMNSETMHNFTLDSNNRNSFTESVLYHSIPPTPSLHENPNPEPFNSIQYPTSLVHHSTTNENDNNFQEIPQNHSQSSHHSSQLYHETDNTLNNNCDFSQFNENLDLLQFLLQLTDTSGQDSTISKENDQK